MGRICGRLFGSRMKRSGTLRQRSVFYQFVSHFELRPETRFLMRRHLSSLPTIPEIVTKLTLLIAVGANYEKI